MSEQASEYVNCVNCGIAGLRSDFYASKVRDQFACVDTMACIRRTQSVEFSGCCISGPHGGPRCGRTIEDALAYAETCRAEIGKGRGYGWPEDLVLLADEVSRLRERNSVFGDGEGALAYTEVPRLEFEVVQAAVAYYQALNSSDTHEESREDTWGLTATGQEGWITVTRRLLGVAMQAHHSLRSSIAALIAARKQLETQVLYQEKKIASSYDSSIYEIFVHRYGKDIADWMAKEFGWKVD